MAKPKVTYATVTIPIDRIAATVAALIDCGVVAVTFTATEPEPVTLPPDVDPEPEPPAPVAAPITKGKFKRTAAQRKAASLRMKRYHANKRKAA